MVLPPDGTDCRWQAQFISGGLHHMANVTDLKKNSIGSNRGSQGA
jgi:hypothetical protein